MPILTLDEAKRQLKIPLDDTSDDMEIQAYCDGITAVIEDYKHEAIAQRTVTEDIEHTTRFGRRFRLWSVPVISITSVTAVVGGQTWDVANLRVSPNSGLVRVLAGPPLHCLAEAVYEAGYETIPEHYKRGAAVVLQHNWETRRGVGGKRAGVIGAEETYDPRWSYSIPRKALEWLGAPRPVSG
ncbi:hypothetical protein NMG29_06630 [Streptomyces cocklensis]|uniref:Uncharacterized protein n=1 Tax=Actinacidiphila cocklensis TaxID=887465 RepID=A0A9W4GRM4_9ACTN|nr:hypothetical protein [Actinacidiphila cocklensis]MDD1057907.1 hypothetical protein [Actinacidiphila cocklensis]CAG6392771.1 conserved hypothetical protein [Actinacidiphila cocklensis]